MYKNIRKKVIFFIIATITLAVGVQVIIYNKKNSSRIEIHLKPLAQGSGINPCHGSNGFEDKFYKKTT